MKVCRDLGPSAILHSQVSGWAWQILLVSWRLQCNSRGADRSCEFCGWLLRAGAGGSRQVRELEPYLSVVRRLKAPSRRCASARRRAGRCEVPGSRATGELRSMQFLLRRSYKL